MAHVVWDRVTREDVVRAIQKYDRLGPDRFFSEQGFGQTMTYELVWDERRYPPKGIVGTAYELAAVGEVAAQESWTLWGGLSLALCGGS